MSNLNIFNDVTTIESLHSLKHSGEVFSMEKNNSSIKCSCGAFYDLNKEGYKLNPPSGNYANNSSYNSNKFNLSSFISMYLDKRSYQTSA